MPPKTRATTNKAAVEATENKVVVVLRAARTAATLAKDIPAQAAPIKTYKVPLVAAKTAGKRIFPSILLLVISFHASMFKILRASLNYNQRRLSSSIEGKILN
jgi:hypothetical protein